MRPESYAYPELQHVDITSFMIKAEEELPGLFKLSKEDKSSFDQYRFERNMYDTPKQHTTMLLALLIFAGLGAMVK